jgi:hypothetical protein
VTATLEGLAATWLGPDPSPSRQAQFVDTITLVLLRAFPDIDHDAVDDELRALFEMALSRAGFTAEVRTPEAFDAVIRQFEADHPPDPDLVDRLAAALLPPR